MILKILTLILISTMTLFAELKDIWVTPDFLENNKNIKVIDIRTPGEWGETGIVENSHLITFFDRSGNFNIQTFLEKLDKVVGADEQFAVICLTGSRTYEVSRFLAHRKDYNVINLRGGISKLIQEGYKPVKYNPKTK